MLACGVLALAGLATPAAMQAALLAAAAAFYLAMIAAIERVWHRRAMSGGQG
jgi:hypothetical protein